MLKKKLGAEAIERVWSWKGRLSISNYFKIPSTLIIPEGCEKVGNGAFDCCNKLKKVKISGSVKSIGTLAFGGCRELGVIVIPESVEEIRDCAFDGCENAVIIIVNKSSESDFKFLGRLVFRDCFTVKYVC